MLKLRDIMTKDVLTVSPELSLRDTMELFAQRHVSGAPVVANGQVLGVVTSTDLLQLAAALPGVPTERDEAEPDEAGDDAEDWESETEPPGTYFTEMWSDAGAESGDRMETSGSPEWNPLEEHTVSEAMTADVVSLSPDTPVITAAEVMRMRKIHRVLVMDRGLLAGIVSSMDITKAAADNKLTSRTYVFASDAARDAR